MWENFPSFECLLNGGSECMNISSVKLQNEWYDGQYIKCVNDSELLSFNGEFVRLAFGIGSPTLVDTFSMKHNVGLPYILPTP